MAYLLRNVLHLLSARHLINTNGCKCINHVKSLSTTSLPIKQKQNAAHTKRAAGDAGEAKANAQKKSKETSVKITLIQNDNVSITALEEALTLAKRRSMHLVQVQKIDPKTHRPVYKLLSSAERLQEELSELSPQEKSAEKGNQNKSEKILNIGSRISDNDLASRLKNISKWLGKRHEVRILIQGTDKEIANAEKVFKAIEEYVKSTVSGKIIQKRTKGAVIKFSILPMIPESENKTTNTASISQ